VLREDIKDEMYDEYIKKTDQLWSSIKDTVSLLDDKGQRVELSIEEKVFILNSVFHMNKTYRKTVEFYYKEKEESVNIIRRPNMAERELNNESIVDNSNSLAVSSGHDH
jgi:hypothetical protein